MLVGGIPSNRYVVIVRAYAARYGKEGDTVLRHALIARLEHERHLGGLLEEAKAEAGSFLVPDEETRGEGRPPFLPDGVSFDLSHYAQKLAQGHRGRQAVRSSTR